MGEALVLVRLKEDNAGDLEEVIALLGLNPLRRNITRPDTRLPQSRAGWQGPYLKSVDHLGRSSEAKDRKKKSKV